MPLYPGSNVNVYDTFGFKRGFDGISPQAYWGKLKKQIVNNQIIDDYFANVRPFSGQL